MVNHVRILAFASMKQIFGKDEISLNLPGDIQVFEFKKLLSEQFPEFRQVMNSVVVAINREFASDEEYIPQGAEIAIFPPVSGGEGQHKVTICYIENNEIDINQVVSSVSFPTTGGVGLFVGIVRAISGREEPRVTDWLEYEAYIPMATAKMQEIADEIRVRWQDIEGIAIIQRVGILKPGTTAVVIACSAAHRGMGIFDAAHYGIDRLKEIVPVWKKEVGISGEEWIEGSYLPGPGE